MRGGYQSNHDDGGILSRQNHSQHANKDSCQDVYVCSRWELNYLNLRDNF